MNYGLAFTPEAHVGLARLDSHLQENVLDELEKVAADPRLLPPRRANDLVHIDVVRDGADKRTVVFVAVSVSHAPRLLRVIRMGHVEGRAAKVIESLGCRKR